MADRQLRLAERGRTPSVANWLFGLPAKQPTVANWLLTRTAMRRLDLAVGRGPVWLSDLALLQLAGKVARQLRDEVQRTRPLVAGQPLARERDQLVRGR